MKQYAFRSESPLCFNQITWAEIHNTMVFRWHTCRQHNLENNTLTQFSFTQCHEKRIDKITPNFEWTKVLFVYIVISQRNHSYENSSLQATTRINSIYTCVCIKYTEIECDGAGAHALKLLYIHIWCVFYRTIANWWER